MIHDVSWGQIWTEIFAINLGFVLYQWVARRVFNYKPALTFWEIIMMSWGFLCACTMFKWGW